MSFFNGIVPLLYFFILGVISWHFRHTSEQPSDYFLAKRRFGALPIGLSVMVSCFSAVNFLAFPGEICAYGLYVLASLPAFFLAAWPVTRFWIPFFRKQRAISIYAFLEKRYDLPVRVTASVIFLLWRLLWMSTALYASCRIMEALTGISFPLLLFASAGVAALYSSLGGMKAVVWSDVLQFFVLLGSIAAAVFFACRGTDFSFRITSSGVLKPFLPADSTFYSFDPSVRITLWSALIGTTVTFLTRFGADQMVMQRYLAARDETAAKRGLWLNALFATFSLSLLALFGVALHLFARQQGFPAGTPPLTVMAALLGRFPAGIPGLIGAGLLAATMSSIDSGLNSASAAISADLLPHFGKKAKKISPRTITILLSLTVLAAAFWLLPELNRNATLFVILNKIVNVFGTPLLAVMLCALFCRRIGARALLYGMIGGVLFTCFSAVFIAPLALHYYALLSLTGSMALIMLIQLGVTLISLWRGR